MLVKYRSTSNMVLSWPRTVYGVYSVALIFDIASSYSHTRIWGNFKRIVKILASNFIIVWKLQVGRSSVYGPFAVQTNKNFPSSLSRWQAQLSRRECVWRRWYALHRYIGRRSQWRGGAMNYTGCRRSAVQGNSKFSHRFSRLFPLNIVSYPIGYFHLI